MLISDHGTPHAIKHQVGISSRPLKDKADSMWAPTCHSGPPQKSQHIFHPQICGLSRLKWKRINEGGFNERTTKAVGVVWCKMSSTMLRRAFSSTTSLASGECVEKICCITFLSSMVDAILSPLTPLEYHSHPLNNTSHRDREDSLCCVGEECLQATIYRRFLLYQ